VQQRVEEARLLEDREPDEARGEVRNAERDGEDVEERGAALLELRDDRGHGQRHGELDRDDQTRKEERVPEGGRELPVPAMRW
jgi:hypothetical protein